MKVYNVLIHGRHADPEIHNFRFEADAVSFARRIVLEYCRNPEDLEEVRPRLNNWILFTIYYSCEGDYVRVSIGELK